jgi:hypothetical protein
MMVQLLFIMLLKDINDQNIKVQLVMENIQILFGKYAGKKMIWMEILISIQFHPMVVLFVGL